MGCATGLSQHTGGQVVGGELHQADRHMRGNGSKVWRSNFTWPVELRGAPRIIPPFFPAFLSGSQRETPWRQAGSDSSSVSPLSGGGLP